MNSLAVSLSKHIEKSKGEIQRVKSMYDFDKGFGNYQYICGVDEVGRGPLAGPIVGASVMLDLNYKNYKDLLTGIKDSKKLTAKKREELSSIIKERALGFKITEITSEIIDEKGIAWCNNEVLKQSALNLQPKAEFVISDGYAVKDIQLNNTFVIKGDAKSASIACASIIAKVYRDNLMLQYAKEYPQYGFEKNMGYGTEEHVKALKQFGPCPIHRKSFLTNILGEI